MIEDYFHSIENTLRRFIPLAIIEITYDKRSKFVGFIKGELRFFDQSTFYFREFVNVEHDVDRYMYVYHYQNADSLLIFRYDNTPHFPYLPTYPHHKHDGMEDMVIPVEQPDLDRVLTEVQEHLGR